MSHAGQYFAILTGLSAQLVSYGFVSSHKFISMVCCGLVFPPSGSLTLYLSVLFILSKILRKIKIVNHVKDYGHNSI